MSELSNNRGRAYEYVCLEELCRAILEIRPAQIRKNSSYFAAQRAWATLSSEEQSTYRKSAKAAIPSIFKLEPTIIEDGSDMLELYIQPDDAGKKGDVRDIIIIRRNITWEIGLSIKHNHLAVKHSRLSANIDFGKEWFDISCSQTYRDAVTPIFDYLKKEKKKGTLFAELANKETDVYMPILNAFIEEIKYQYQKHPQIPTKMVEYLLSKYDFYKIISEDSQRLTLVQAYNTHGSLNKPTSKKEPEIQVPIAHLPSRIVDIDFKPGSNTTVELYLDGGWSFSFRIHNAERICNDSLKFDIQLIGVPAAIISINCIWS